MIKAKFQCVMPVEDFGSKHKKIDLFAIHSIYGENDHFTPAAFFGHILIEAEKDSKASMFFNQGENYEITIKKVT